MKLTMLQFWQAVRASYWFVPSIMVVLAILLGALMVWLDAGPLSHLFDGLTWYQKSKPAGAREVLSAIASSAITVAGVAFSITIVAISFAANQYGPRILTNFMSDRGNQITLGTFIATFVYSVMVLRTIYGGETVFVPQLAVLGALILALASTGMLIYFIHHVPHSIHVNTVLASIGRQLIHSIAKRFPQCLGDSPDQSGKEQEHFRHVARAAFSENSDVCEIDCLSNGYLQALDDDGLLKVAKKHDLILKLERSPGEFLYRGQVMFRVSPAGRVDEHVRSQLRESWTVGSSRTPNQDQMFLIDELVEIASRALSTGVNDPFTAITCIDWLTAGAAELAKRQEPSPYRIDKDGKLRVVAPDGNFQTHIAHGFGRLRPYAARDVNAATHFLAQLEVLASECRTASEIEALATEAEALVDLASHANSGVSLEQIQKYAASARAKFAERLSDLAGPNTEAVTTKARIQATNRTGKSPRRPGAARQAVE